MQWTLLSLIAEDNLCASLFVCSYPINLPFLSISESRSGLIVVSPSQKIKLYPDNSTHCHIYNIITTA